MGTTASPAEPADSGAARPAASTPEPPALAPAEAWSRRIRRIGGFIQTAFSALWLLRASLALPGSARGCSAASSWARP